MLTRMRSSGSPRRFGAGLILLALWLQALAPAAGLLTRARAAEAAAVDALIHAVICGRPPGEGIAADLTTPASADCDRCPFCRCTATVPLPVPPATAVRRLAWHPVAWPIPPPMRQHRPPRVAALARAPPHLV